MNSLLIVAALITIAIAIITWFGDGRERLWEAVFGPPEEPVDFAELNPPPAAHCFLAAPETQSLQTKPQMYTPVFSVDTARLRQEMRRIVRTEPLTERVGMDPDWLGDRFIQRTRWLRVPELIQVRYIPLDAGHSTFAIYSRCLVPEHGGGHNEERVKRWIAELEQTLGDRAEKA